MDQHLYDLIAQYGIYAVFALCTVEGDITLLISGTMAHGGLFGNWGFAKLFVAGTLGGVVGDSVIDRFGKPSGGEGKVIFFLSSGSDWGNAALCVVGGVGVADGAIFHRRQ